MPTSKSISGFQRRADLRFFLSIIAAGLLSFTGVVIETAMNITFPTLMQEFAISTSTVQWITTGYLLILAIVIYHALKNETVRTEAAANDRHLFR